MTDGAVTMLGDLSIPEAAIRTLAAERACWETYLTYFEVLDDKRSHLEACACFTEDATITYGMKGGALEFTSRAEYADFLEGAAATQEMVAHVVGQHRFVWDGGTPRLITYVTVWQWFVANAHGGELRPADYVTIGHSVDEFRNVGDAWLIARRTVRPAAGITAIGSRPA
ncbi:nuclear transport factor 2 family protein [Pseudonocardia cypriaca]|nr:nuclear transport factor 2 family protein [Pseudonocardia cypriaca]